MGRYTTQLRFVVYLMHTKLSFASWCIISKIHNSASPRVVYFCVSNSRQLKNIIRILQGVAGHGRCRASVGQWPLALCYFT